jgi:hypothetical protein
LVVEALVKLSIVIPVFQLKGRESSLLAYMCQLEKEIGSGLRFVLVDDASPDDALSELKLIAKQSGLDVLCLKLDRRAGQYTTTAVGLAQVKEGWAVTVDDDGQHGPDSVASLVRFAQTTGDTLVYGSSTLPFSNLVRFLKFFLTWGYPASKALSSLRLVKFPFAHHGSTVSYLDGELMDAANGVESIPVAFSRGDRQVSGYKATQKWGIALRLLLFHNRLPWYLPALVTVLLELWWLAMVFAVLQALAQFGSTLYKRPVTWTYL